MSESTEPPPRAKNRKRQRSNDISLTSVDLYTRAAHDAGCPPDQVRNFIRAGIVLQPRQLEFAAAARLCDRPEGPTKIALGGARGPGKSHTIICQLGDDGTRYPNLKALLLRKVGASAREGFEALLPKTIGRLGRYVPSQSVFRFHGADSTIRLGHFQNERDIDKYLGLEYDVVALEEATTLSFSKKTAISSCCRSPAGSGFRAREYNSTNPGGIGHAWFKRLFVDPFRRGDQTDTRFIPCTVRDNKFASPEYVKFLESLTGWLRRAWLDGDWDIAAGQFFTTWKRESHVIPRGAIPPNWRVWLAMDYGFVHYTVVYLFAEDGDGNVFVVDEHAERGWIIPRHARAIRSMLDRNGVAQHRVERFVAGEDCFTRKQNGASIAADYEAEGFRLTPADTDRINGAAEVLSRLGDLESDPPMPASMFISAACSRLIDCVPYLEHDELHPEKVKKIDTDENGLGGDDFYDAMRYGVMVAARPRQGKTRSLHVPRAADRFEVA